MSSEPVISVRNLTKRYALYRRPADRLWQMLSRGRLKLEKTFTALEDVSFDVGRGECLGIIGKNGAGKSTILQLLAGTLAATSGSLEVKGRVAALLELGSGINPEFTGEENIWMYGAFLGLDPERLSARYDDIVRFADIGEAINQPVKTYSSGMAMRLAFAVVAHIDAEILIVDEALAVGDVVFVQKCFAFLREYIRHHTVIVVSHDLASIRDLCNRVLWLEGGRVRADGEPMQVTDDYLASCYESVQGESEIGGIDETKAHEQAKPDADVRLARWRERPDGTPQYSFFEFDENAPSFGKGGARIRDIRFVGEDGVSLQSVAGGETIRLQFCIEALQPIARPIVGFAFRNGRGENLFGDNTFESYESHPVALSTGDILEASFAFVMPRLPPGEYALHAAIADGTQDDHVQHQWFHNALTITSVYHGKTGVMVGIPMREIVLTKRKARNGGQW